MLAANKTFRRVALGAMITAAALTVLPAGTASASSYSDQQRQLQTLIQQKENSLHRLNHQANDLFGQLQEAGIAIRLGEGGKQGLLPAERPFETRDLALFDATYLFRKLAKRQNRVGAGPTSHANPVLRPAAKPTNHRPRRL